MAKSGRGGGVHTVPRGNGWANTVNGRTTSEHHTKAPAEKAGRREAIRRETEHTIHKKNGQISEKNSYGNDPERSKG